MMSRTVRYFKLIYIVAGILLSNEEICETVDQIQIATRVEMKEKTNQPPMKKIQRSESVQNTRNKNSLSKCWYRRFDVFDILNRFKRRIRPQWSTFSMWTIANYFIECSTNLLHRKFIINSDCDVIYK